jgi:DNA-binding transcriptional ArsR family regulator
MSISGNERAPSLEDVESVFFALSHEARRHIVLLLSQSGGELPSGYLATRFQHTWPTTTRHLGMLEKAGIIKVRREGRSSHYSLNRERLREVIEGWLGLLEPVGPEKKWSSRGPKSTHELKKKKGSRNEQSKHPANLSRHR